MGVSLDNFTKLVRSKFPDAKFTIESTTGDDEHYELEIHSVEFQGLTTLAQHRLVYDRIGVMKDDLHALSLKTKAITGY